MKGQLCVPPSVLLLALFAYCGSIFSHHSVQGYTRGESTRVSVTGVVKEFRWANPHAQLYLDETMQNGEVRTWGFELNSPGNLTRRAGGWTHNVVKTGETVTATFNPAVEGRLAGACLALELSDGRQLRSGQGCSDFDNN